MPERVIERFKVARIKISKASVDLVQPQEREAVHWDDRLAGFGLKVTPAGSKVYIYRYRMALPGQAAATPPKKYTIGKHGELTPDQARKRAQELAALVATGIDPREREAEALNAKQALATREEELRRLEQDLAFDRIAARWLEHYEHEKGRRPSSVTMAKMVVRLYLKPSFGSRPIPKIELKDLQSVIDAIPLNKRAMRRNVFAYASVLFGWALRRQYISTNPLASMEKPQAPIARDRVLDDVELAMVWKAAEAMPVPWAPFYRLLIMTGQRKSEVAGMAWSELDRSSAIWTIPAERAKNKNSHLVPLSEAVTAELDVLADGQQWPTTGYVLTTTGRTPISGFSKAKRMLDQKITDIDEGGALPPWRVHDLRRTAATGLQRLGVRFEVTEAVLNHVSGAKGGIAGVYQRHDWAAEKRAALDAWAGHVRQLITGITATNVVRMEARS